MNTPSGVTISNIKIGTTNVAKTGNWTYTSGTLKIKSSYLSAKDNGAIEFTVNMSNGDAVTLTITVGA